jgi:DNA polymerase I-like protein with 3'-5' exonuclease and polymerase domains
MSRIYWDRRKSHALDALTEFLCPQLCEWKEDTKKELTRIKTRYSRLGYEKDYANFSFLPEELISSRGMIDTFMTLVIHLRLKPIMDEQFTEHYPREMKTSEVVSKVEAHGMAFDSKKARNAARYPRRRMRECMETMKLLAGDWLTTHPPKLVKAMQQLGITRKQLTEKGKVTTVADVLNRVLKETIPDKAREFITSLLTYKGYQKIANTYLLPLAKRAETNNGIVYTEINPADTRTGRPASKNPNLLNIPNPESRKTGKKNVVRECFVCRPGHAIYYFDVSQQEYAVFGLYADERILNAYMRGEDIHQYMADQLGMSDQRSRVKNINFGVVYGMGIRAMKLLYGLTEDDYRLYHREFPSICDFQQMCEYELKQYGCVTDYFGRRYHIPVGQAYKAVNALVQGTSASAFKVGLIAVDRNLQPDEHIILPVYDEIQAEKKLTTKKRERSFVKNVIKRMAHIPQIEERGLVFRIDVAKSVTNWAEKQPLEI